VFELEVRVQAKNKTSFLEASCGLGQSVEAFLTENFLVKPNLRLLALLPYTTRTRRHET